MPFTWMTGLRCPVYLCPSGVLCLPRVNSGTVVWGCLWSRLGESWDAVSGVGVDPQPPAVSRMPLDSHPASHGGSSHHRISFLFLNLVQTAGEGVFSAPRQPVQERELLRAATAHPLPGLPASSLLANPSMCTWTSPRGLAPPPRLPQGVLKVWLSAHWRQLGPKRVKCPQEQVRPSRLDAREW